MGGDMSVIEKLSDLIVGLDPLKLPDRVTEKVKQCIFHALACSCGGYHLPWSRAAIDHLKELDTTGRSTVLIAGLKASPPDAALANSVLGHSIIQEDMHMGSTSHPGSMIIPAAMAMGEHVGCSGVDLIGAIVLGYELMSRIGRSVVSMEFCRTHRPSSVLGPLGAAAAGAKLLGLDRQRTADSLGLAGNLSMGFNQWAVEGTDDLYFQNGYASSNGVRAALIGGQGGTFSKRIIEGRAGLLAAFGKKPESEGIATVTDEEWAVEEVYYKKVPACAFVQTGTILAHEMSQRHDMDLKEISDIRIYTFQVARDYPGLDHTGPFSSINQAKMSLPFSVSSMLVSKEISQEAFDRYEDPEVGRLAGLCTLEADTGITLRFPEKQGSRIVIRMRDGQEIQGEREDVSVMTPTEVLENFRVQAGRYFKEDRIGALTELVQKLEQVDDIRKITGLLASSDR